jgi:hypothetical protein
MPARRAEWFGTGASECERKSGTLEPAVLGGFVLHSCAASTHRGDRGLQSASEANGVPQPNHKSKITNFHCLREKKPVAFDKGDKVTGKARDKVGARAGTIRLPAS